MDTCSPGWGLWGVGQVRLQGAPDPLHRVLVRTVPGAVQQMYPMVLRQPSLHSSGGVDDHVVEHQGDGRSARTGRQDLLQKGAEARTACAPGHSLDPSSTANIDSAEKSVALVLAVYENPPPPPTADPGRAHPGQQIDVTFVIGKDDRVRWERRYGPTHPGPALLGFTVTLGHQPGRAPRSDFAKTAPDNPHREVQVPAYIGCGPLTRLGHTVDESGSQLQAPQSGPSQPWPIRLAREPLLRLRGQPPSHSAGMVEGHPSNLIGSIARQRRTKHEGTEHEPPIVMEAAHPLGVGHPIGKGRWKMHAGCALVERGLGSCKATAHPATGLSPLPPVHGQDSWPPAQHLLGPIFAQAGPVRYGAGKSRLERAPWEPPPSAESRS